MRFATPAVLALRRMLLYALLLTPLSGCALVPGHSDPYTAAIQHAQSRLRFIIRVPSCLPSDVDPVPSRVHVVNQAGNGFQSVDFEYAYRDPAVAAARGLAYGIGITEEQNLGGERILFMSGQHKILDGIEVVVSTPHLAPGMEWIQGMVSFDIVSTLSWDDTLRVYHSMVMESSDCGLPSGSETVPTRITADPTSGRAWLFSR